MRNAPFVAIALAVCGTCVVGAAVAGPVLVPKRSNGPVRVLPQTPPTVKPLAPGVRAGVLAEVAALKLPVVPDRTPMETHVGSLDSASLQTWFTHGSRFDVHTILFVDASTVSPGGPQPGLTVDVLKGGNWFVDCVAIDADSAPYTIEIWDSAQNYVKETMTASNQHLAFAMVLPAKGKGMVTLSRAKSWGWGGCKFEPI